MQDHNLLDKIFTQEQTELVNCLLNTDFTCMQIDNNFDDVYIWWLISPYYVDVIQELEFPITEFKGQYWFGQTWYGASIKQTEYWTKLQEKLPFLCDDDCDDMVIDSDDETDEILPRPSRRILDSSSDEDSEPEEQFECVLCEQSADEDELCGHGVADRHSCECLDCDEYNKTHNNI